jgi:hypothetical protein
MELSLGRNHNGGFLHFDQAGIDPLLQLWKDCIDFLARFDELNLDGKVVGYFENTVAPPIPLWKRKSRMLE